MEYSGVNISQKPGRCNYDCWERIHTWILKWYVPKGEKEKDRTGQDRTE
jgi:hypothetical protein